MKRIWNIMKNEKMMELSSAQSFLKLNQRIKITICEGLTYHHRLLGTFFGSDKKKVLESDRELVKPISVSAIALEASRHMM